MDDDRFSAIISVTAVVVGVAFFAFAIIYRDSLHEWTFALIKAQSLLMSGMTLFLTFLLYLFCIALLISLLLMAWRSVANNPASSELPTAPPIEKLPLESDATEKRKVFKLEPNLYGIGVDLRELWKWLGNYFK